jgi:hypothetical protein
MSIRLILLWCGFLGFFLVILPLALYLFGKFLPERFPSYVGFPWDSEKLEDIGMRSRTDDRAGGQ